MRSCFSLAIPSSLRFFQKRPSCGSPCSRGNRSLATAVSASYPPSRSYSDFLLMTCLLERSGERSATAPHGLVPEILGREGERRSEVRYGDDEAVDLPEEWGRHAAEDSAIPCWAQGGANVLA